MTIEERVAASRASQGLPPRINDPVECRAFARLLLTHRKTRDALNSVAGQEEEHHHAQATAS